MRPIQPDSPTETQRDSQTETQTHSPPETQHVTHKARKPRFDLRAPVAYSGEPGTGRGLIWNISTSGLRIEAASVEAPLGTELRIRASYFAGSSEVTLHGRVVRHTEGGFAVQFENLPFEAQELLNQILPPTH